MLSIKRSNSLTGQQESPPGLLFGCTKPSKPPKLNDCPQNSIGMCERLGPDTCPSGPSWAPYHVSTYTSASSRNCSLQSCRAGRLGLRIIRLRLTFIRQFSSWLYFTEFSGSVCFLQVRALSPLLRACSFAICNLRLLQVCAIFFGLLMEECYSTPLINPIFMSVLSRSSVFRLIGRL